MKYTLKRDLHIYQLAKEVMFEVGDIVSFYTRQPSDSDDYRSDREIAQLIVDRVSEILYPLTSDPFSEE